MFNKENFTEFVNELQRLITAQDKMIKKSKMSQADRKQVMLNNQLKRQYVERLSEIL